MKILVDVESVKGAADYLARHNTKLSKDPDFYEHKIWQQINEYANKEEVSSSGTAGFHISYIRESDGELSVEVFVSPCVGRSNFVYINPEDQL